MYMHNMFSILPWCPFIVPLIYYQDDWMHNNELSSVQRQLIWYSATELIPMKMLNIDHLLKLLLMYKCGHRTLLSKRQVWMSIFHIINFKKKIMDTGVLDFFNKKLILDYYFCLKSGLVFLFQIFIIAPLHLPLPRDIKFINYWPD
jgi:hypothetical protein